MPSKNGLCTTKNIYRHLSSQNLIQLPQQGSRSILPQANQILQSAWKSRNLPPLMKTFTWRLIRRALATAERAARYCTHIDKHYATCGAVEDDAHLFFHCNLPRVVWFSFNPSMRTDNLPNESDGVQQILQCFISNLVSESLLQKILITSWYIWKARNDRRFQRNTWTPMQVHNAVAAHINTHMQAQILSTDAAVTQLNATTQPPQNRDHDQSGTTSTLVERSPPVGHQQTVPGAW